MLTLTKLPKINILFHNKNTNYTKIIKNHRIDYIIISMTIISFITNLTMITELYEMYF